MCIDFPSYIAKPFQGRELVARVHLQMQLGKRRAELEVSRPRFYLRKSTNTILHRGGLSMFPPSLQLL